MLQFFACTEGDFMSECCLREEFAGCQFGDARLSKRIRNIVDVLQDHPNRSIPAAFVTRADWEACYRFFDNESVTPEKLVEPHFQASHVRIQEFETVLLVQDTTELDLTRPQQQVRGAGPMDCESRRGAFFHPLMAFTTEGVPLGLVGMQTWTRQSLNRDEPSKKHSKREALPIEEKESYRWLVGLQSAAQTAQACPETTCICAGDSESDIYELYALAHQLREKHSSLHLLVRAGQNRATSQDALWMEVARRAPVIGTQTIQVREREAKVKAKSSPRSQSREARKAEVEIRATTVEVRRPNHLTKLPNDLKFHVVLVEETNPPEGEEKISWMLVTTLPIDTPEQIQAIISYYCRRWQIEVYFKTLKSGCQIEYRRFETLDRVLNCLAVLAVVAWRVMYVTYLGRTCPDLPCEAVFEPSEWKSVYAILKRRIPSEGCPNLQELVRAIAMLGGFVNRVKNEPGTQTVWTGLQRCYDLSNAWDTFGPGAKKFSSD
jgi:hypothetical protein